MTLFEVVLLEIIGLKKCFWWECIGLLTDWIFLSLFDVVTDNELFLFWRSTLSQSVLRTFWAAGSFLDEDILNENLGIFCCTYGLWEKIYKINYCVLLRFGNRRDTHHRDHFIHFVLIMFQKHFHTFSFTFSVFCLAFSFFLITFMLTG